MIVKKINILALLFFMISFHHLFSQHAVSLKDNSYTYLKSNLEFLASDELEGREATSRGEKLASLFISEELEKYEVLPFGDNGTYFQNFNMILTGFNENSSLSIINENKEEVKFQNGAHIVYNPRNFPDSSYNAKIFEIVFAGYGIFSEADHYNSYDDVDVKGKIVLVINGTPKINGEEILSKDVVRKYQRSSTKIELAKVNGAVGLLVLPNDETLKYWDYIQEWAKSRSYKLEEEFDPAKSTDHIPTIMLNDVSAEVLLRDEIIKYTSLIKDQDPNPKSFDLKSKIKFDYTVLIEKKSARNVIGIIEGNNENLKNEFLTIGAHYDHLGLREDSVYNGADDNGSGTVTILEVARKLAISKINQRPVVVIFHTAEEKGLKGAKYLTNYSDFVDDAIVHINIDMVGRRSEDSIYCIGASKISSELGEIIEEVNSETSMFTLDYKFDDPNDPQRLYNRSDHVHYANKGIPIAFFYDYMKKDYHKPTDTVEKINFDKMIRMTELIYNLILRISNLDHKLTVDDTSLN